jgi:hypothetical protein
METKADKWNFKYFSMYPVMAPQLSRVSRTLALTQSSLRQLISVLNKEKVWRNVTLMSGVNSLQEVYEKNV